MSDARDDIAVAVDAQARALREIELLRWQWWASINTLDLRRREPAVVDRAVLPGDLIER